MLMKVIATSMLFSGAAVGAGAALEFAYFGPWTAQFIAGLVATPAGLLGMAGGAALWRKGIRARALVTAAATALLLGTAVATALDVMGPPATIVGILGGLPSLLWVWKKRGVPRKHPDEDEGKR
jgi:hypothetical protein